MHVSTKSQEYATVTLRTWVHKIYYNCQLILLFTECHLLTSLHMFFLYPAPLRRIDLSGNLISEIEDGAFSKLPDLEELILAENKLTRLPILPTKLVSFNANFNKLKTQGVKATAFKVS